MKNYKAQARKFANIIFVLMLVFSLLFSTFTLRSFARADETSSSSSSSSGSSSSGSSSSGSSSDFDVSDFDVEQYKADIMRFSSTYDFVAVLDFSFDQSSELVQKIYDYSTIDDFKLGDYSENRKEVNANDLSLEYGVFVQAYGDLFEPLVTNDYTTTSFTFNAKINADLVIVCAQGCEVDGNSGNADTSDGYAWFALTSDTRFSTFTFTPSLFNGIPLAQAPETYVIKELIFLRQVEKSGYFINGLDWSSMTRYPSGFVAVWFGNEIFSDQLTTPDYTLHNYGSVWGELRAILQLFGEDIGDVPDDLDLSDPLNARTFGSASNNAYAKYNKNKPDAPPINDSYKNPPPRKYTVRYIYSMSDYVETMVGVRSEIAYEYVEEGDFATKIDSITIPENCEFFGWTEALWCPFIPQDEHYRDFFNGDYTPLDLTKSKVKNLADVEFGELDDWTFFDFSQPITRDVLLFPVVLKQDDYYTVTTKNMDGTVIEEFIVPKNGTLTITDITINGKLYHANDQMSPFRGWTEYDMSKVTDLNNFNLYSIKIFDFNKTKITQDMTVYAVIIERDLNPSAGGNAQAEHSHDFTFKLFGFPCSICGITIWAYLWSAIKTYVIAVGIVALIVLGAIIVIKIFKRR